MSGYVERLPSDLRTSHSDIEPVEYTRQDTTSKETLEAHEVIRLPRHRLRRSLGGLAIAASLLNTAYILPILNEEHQLSETHATIKEIAQPVDPLDNHSTTVVIGGFGTRDSEPIVEALAPLNHLGYVDAVREDNRGVDADAMAKEIMEQAKMNNQTEIGLWGDSMGGLLAARIARIIQTSDTKLRVRYIMLDCTPTTFRALRKDKQEQLQAVETVTNILPDIELHPAFQYFYTGVTNGQNPITLASGINGPEVIDKINNPATASTSLLESEARYVLTSSLKDDLAAIGRVTKKKAPLIMSIRPASPTGDAIVDSSTASLELEHFIEGTGLTMHQFALDGISHGDPTSNRAAYQASLTSQIIPALQTYESDWHPKPQTLTGPRSPQ